MATILDFRDLTFGVPPRIPEPGEYKYEYWEFIQECIRDDFQHVFRLNRPPNAHFTFEYPTVAMKAINARFDNPEEVYRTPDILSANRLVVFKRLEDAMLCLVAGDIKQISTLEEWVKGGRHFD